jgi:hypothetical protein
LHPAVTINKQMYMGEFIAEDMAHAICTGFNERPHDWCDHSFIKDFLTRRDKWNIPDYGNSIASDIIFYAVIIAAINIVILGYCKWKK